MPFLIMSVAALGLGMLGAYLVDLGHPVLGGVLILGPASIVGWKAVAFLLSGPKRGAF